jgi:hypothetical protein
VYRRRIRLRAGAGLAVGDLEDDFHRFRVRLEHDGSRVVRASGEALRFPWSSCPGALAPLERLAGLPLGAGASAAARHTDPRAQCTHLFDLAGLAAAQAARGEGGRDYRIAVPDRVGGRTRAELARDGRPLLAWEVEHGTIRSPAPFAGRRLGYPEFLRWAEGSLDPDLAEAALALHRALSISLGRLYDMDAVAGPAAFGRLAGGACHTFSPGIMEGARRELGSAREFSARPEALLADP